jgi:hypothetical protein
MPNDQKRDEPAPADGTRHEDGPMPSASDSTVLEETARMAREGLKELEADPNERKPG